MSRDPITLQQWQIAVDGAHACLLIESARLYGLVSGGPEVNVERCERIVRGGKMRGIVPAANCVEQFIREWQASVTIKPEVLISKESPW